MKVFLFTIGLLATALAAPTDIPLDSDGTVSVVQSSDGAYTLNVNLREYGRKEERLTDGTVFGEYSVPDASGTLQTFKYMAGKEGFRILEGPLPVAPVDTNVPVVDHNIPVVAEVAETALPLTEEIKIIPANLLPSALFPQLLETILPTGFNVHQGAPEPVEETPEVMAARAEHLAAYREALKAVGQLN